MVLTPEFRLMGLACAVILFGTADAALARTADQLSAASSSQPQPSKEPDRKADFLFGRPSGSVGVRGAWTFASAGSDLFDFVTDQLTIEKSDFNGPGVAGDVSFSLTDRLDMQAGFGFGQVSTTSEYRDFVDNDFLPINQSTTLKTTQIVGSLRYSLMARGRDVSRFAWVPSRVVPFVGAGAGAVYYNFTQTGDFVDFQDFGVFTDVFTSKGWAPSVHFFGGADVQLYRGLYATIEGRYSKAAATLNKDFIDFDPIDLSAFRVSAGVNLLF